MREACFRNLLIIAISLPTISQIYAQQSATVSNVPWAVNLTLTSNGDAVYSRYRAGTIKRHIASNGRFLQYLWLRTEDAADIGAISWPRTSPTVSMAGNRRTSWDGASFLHSWLPVAFYEIQPRAISPRYAKGKLIGYVAIEPASGRVPLYEWEHNTLKEKPVENFVDHYYSTDPNSLVARYRYHSNGIVAYLQTQASPGSVPLFVGFDHTEMNHKLFTDKSNPGHLEHVQPLAYAYAQPTGPFQIPLIEYRQEDPTCAPCRDNMYSAVSKQTIQIETRRGPLSVLVDKHFQARWVVAGGGDNPLYQGGLLLAVFSLEHLNGVSGNSLGYAKRLFDFIESSEEQSASILAGIAKPNGMLRRSRHPWFHHPQNQMATGERWSASTDELVGVIMGLWYFERATRDTDLAYNQRAKALLGRIAQYLKDRLWVYADSRLDPNVSALLAEPSITQYGAGTLAFNYPISRIFQSVLGDSYSGPEMFQKVSHVAIDFADEVWPPSGVYADFLLFSWPVAACVAEVVTEFTDKANFVLGCGRSIDTFSEVYELEIENAFPYVDYHGYNTDGFYNHTMLMYTAWMVLNADSVGSDRRKTFAKKVLRYIHDMWGGPMQWYGIARNNALFAVVAKRCFQLLTQDEILDALGLDQRRAVLATYFRQEVDSVIYQYVSGATTWRPDLPLGEPLYDLINGTRQPHSPKYPWENQWPMAGQTKPWNPTSGAGQDFLWFVGIGNDEAWQHANPLWGGNVDAFAFWNSYEGTDPDSVFDSIGPWYSDSEGKLSLPQTLANLKQCCRIGYTTTDAEYRDLSVGDGLFFKVEAGGVDLLIARMLLVAIGESPAPHLLEDDPFPVLPIDGETPW